MELTEKAKNEIVAMAQDIEARHLRDPNVATASLAMDKLHRLLCILAVDDDNTGKDGETDWEPIDLETTPYNVDIELWSYREGSYVGRRMALGWTGTEFARDWVTADSPHKICAPTHWRPIRPPKRGTSGAG